jgi:hypothetical protein
MSVYRTAATLGQILNFVGAAQKQKTKVINLPPIGHILDIDSYNQIGLRKVLANQCNLPKFQMDKYYFYCCQTAEATDMDNY